MKAKILWSTKKITTVPVPEEVEGGRARAVVGVVCMRWRGELNIFSLQIIYFYRDD